MEKNLPHVLVALRLNVKGGKKLKMGDTVAYIICLDGSDLPATQRAYHPDELKTNEALKIDVLYYLTQQIHPVVSRLCAPIEGADAAMIAKLLGLDASKYQSVIRNVEDEEDKLLNPSSLFDDEERFKNCEKLLLKCPAAQCSEEIVIDSPFNKEAKSFQCPKCKTFLLPFAANLRNQLEKIMRSYISKYYKHTLICDDVGCAYQSRKMPLVFTSGGPVCPACRNSNLHLEYSEAELYTQLAYFQSLFDYNKVQSNLSSEEKSYLRVGKDEKELYEKMKISADKILHQSGYGIVNLSSLFEGLYQPDSSSL